MVGIRRGDALVEVHGGPCVAATIIPVFINTHVLLILFGVRYTHMFACRTFIYCEAFIK
jgi:hypothetical protein